MKDLRTGILEGDSSLHVGMTGSVFKGRGEGCHSDQREESLHSIGGISLFRREESLHSMHGISPFNQGTSAPRSVLATSHAPGLWPCEKVSDSSKTESVFNIVVFGWKPVKKSVAGRS